jgi:hypothetical protein
MHLKINKKGEIIHVEMLEEFTNQRIDSTNFRYIIMAVSFIAGIK